MIAAPESVPPEIALVVIVAVPIVGEEIVGDADNTTLPVPVDPVNVGACAATPVPVDVRNFGTVVVFPDRNEVVLGAD